MENGSVTPKGLVLRDRRTFHQPAYRALRQRHQPYVPLNVGGQQHHSSRNYSSQFYNNNQHQWMTGSRLTRRGFPPSRRNLVWTGTGRGSVVVDNNNNYPHALNPSTIVYPNISSSSQMGSGGSSGSGGEDYNNNGITSNSGSYSGYSSTESSEDSVVSGGGIFEEDDEYVPQPVSKMVDSESESVYKTGDTESSINSVKTYENPPLLPGCVEDENSFLEMHIACVAPGLLNKEKKAAFGIWFGRQSVLNFGGVLPADRPQTLKAVLIWASTQAIQLMKSKGFIKLKLIMESEFMIQNVSGWAYKFMNAEVRDENEKAAMCSNWDELKYVQEIWELSKIFKGMLLKWTHVTSETYGVKCAKSLARHSLSNTTLK